MHIYARANGLKHAIRDIQKYIIDREKPQPDPMLDMSGLNQLGTWLTWTRPYQHHVSE